MRKKKCAHFVRTTKRTPHNRPKIKRYPYPQQYFGSRGSQVRILVPRHTGKAFENQAFTQDLQVPFAAFQTAIIAQTCPKIALFGCIWGHSDAKSVRNVCHTYNLFSNL